MSGNITELQKGFLLNNRKDIKENDDLAFHTLRLAITSYFSTYKAMEMNFNIYKEDKNFLESQEYIGLYISTIIHFQHFFELFIKSILRDIDELLVIEGVKDPYVLYKLIQKEEIKPNEDININSIGFNRTIEVFTKLKEHNLIDKKYYFLDEYKREIKALNNLRNRILHRGLYILPYKELDIFLVKRILPIINEIQELEEAERKYKVWVGKDLACGIDILQSLCSEGRGEFVNHRNIALLKELGRASYSNPLYSEDEGFGNFYGKLNNIMIRKYESIANVEMNIEQVDHIEQCPCCGSNTLACYIDEECEYDEYEGKYYISDVFDIFTEATCTCCSFKINQFINEDALKKYIGENNIWNI